MTYKLKADWGKDWFATSKEAKEMAAEKNCDVEFEFNGLVCVVNATTNLEWLWRDYLNARLMDWKTIGPYSVENYSAEIQVELDKRTKERDARRAEIEKLQNEKDSKAKALFEEKVKGIAMEFSDEAAWNQFKEANKDPYGATCVEYAEGWARLMQFEFSQGRNIADCAEKTSYELDFLGITGFMYGCAVSMLAKCWKHGEALRLWHNLKTQIGTEGEKANDTGGVLNPALLNIG